jgi:hypothetical protein
MQRDAINRVFTPCAGDNAAAMICGMQQTPRSAAEAAVADSTGIFAVGRSRFEAYDPARHHPLPAAPGGSVADQAVVGGEQAG